MARLQDKVLVITGGTSGIGKRAVELCAAEGAFVVMGARRVAEGNAIAAALGERVEFLATDVTREADMERLIGRAMERHGRIDCLVNNAGGPAPVGGIETIPFAGYQAAMDVLLGSVMLGMKHVAPIMSRQEAGSIVNIASVAGLRAGLSSSMIYSAAKAAVIHLTRCVAMQLGERGVRVNSISPGGIATGIFGKALGLPTEKAEATAQAVSAALAKFQPIPRAGQPDDIAEAIVYLASDQSSFVNGNDLVIDGGLVGGRFWSVQQQGLEQMRKAFGIAIE